MTEGLRVVAGGARLMCTPPVVARRLHRYLHEPDALRGDLMGNRHHEPGGRAEDRRRQFEDSRGLTGRRDLPLDDESEADEPDADETEAGKSEADQTEADETGAGESDRDPGQGSAAADEQADDQR